MKKVINMINPSSKVSGVSLLNIKKAEKAIGAIFPEEYKELFLKTNGAKFGDWTLFPIQTNDEYLLADILTFNRDSRPDNLPEDMICIGENNYGDILCYRIRKRYMQELIFLWDHKTGLCDNKASNLYEFIDWYVPKVNTNKPNIVGSFTVNSDRLVITDPFYEMGEDELQIVLSEVKKGVWTSSISYTDDEVVKSLFVFHGEKPPSGKWHKHKKMIAVDSAQAGVFDFDSYGKDEIIQNEVENIQNIELKEYGSKYYIACCDAVSSIFQGGIIPNGAVAMSGYGDGMYPVHLKYNISKQIVGVKIDFEED
ncbi:SMI1/KNR4 family protein [Niallia taxi]|uniref:SMI1/KNR4 family protein n=1 Tax=Niallia taxi TaxID=2499688 RepID=UPI0030081779